ncbi:MAG TPA: serine hydrolase domain-containing protein, partial [Gemmatimonadaceae bacterium]|nr:serine hydrolase domain-containing protein [Gemmatimonadaceae bacterium]
MDSTTPGCAVGVNRRGQPIYRGAFGLANLETATPITLSTVFQAASIAKQMTAMTVMLLVRDGKLSLDDDIRKFIPELPDYGARITVRHLLTHTSGLRDFFEMLILARGRFEEDRITHSDMMDMVTRQKSLNFKPGDEFLYSNTGYALLEVIVSRVAGKPLREFAAERIFKPLGMTHTLFKDDYAELVPGRAEGYGRRGTGWRSSTPNYDVYGSTNLFTTIGDLLIWAANLDHPRIGDSSIVRQMQTSAVLNNGDRTDYGFGLSLWNDRGTTVVEHEGGDPGFHSYLARYLQDSLAIAVLCNAPSDPVSLGHAIADIYRGPIRQPAHAAASAATSPVDPQVLARRAGVYFQPTTLEVVELTVRDGQLFTRRRGGRRLDPIDANRFRVAGREIEHDFGPEDHSGYTARSLIPGHHPVHFEWKEPVVATPALL